ncbi:MAG: hypothetical protein RBT60_10565 [Candidatus Krumholzibacteria bacterium]|jgi:hypothetical protein|nr:hypothetical protein [Candidatus Krumholzibacteria bacterium]
MKFMSIALFISLIFSAHGAAMCIVEIPLGDHACIIVVDVEHPDCDPRLFNSGVAVFTVDENGVYINDTLCFLFTKPDDITDDERTRYANTPYIRNAISKGVQLDDAIRAARKREIEAVSFVVVQFEGVKSVEAFASVRDGCVHLSEFLDVIEYVVFNKDIGQIFVKLYSSIGAFGVSYWVSNGSEFVSDYVGDYCGRLRKFRDGVLRDDDKSCRGLVVSPLGWRVIANRSCESVVDSYNSYKRKASQ